MSFTILSDDAVKSVLHALDKDDVLALQQTLADSLHVYSNDDDTNGCDSSYQLPRQSLRQKDGRTTLFMPACSNDNVGIKVVTLSAGDSSSAAGHSRGSSTPSSKDAPSLAQSLSQSLSSASMSSSPSPSSPADAPPDIEYNIKGRASIQYGASNNKTAATTPRGALTLFDSTGLMRALINAEEITAFRTALASTMLFKKRQNVHDVTIFGAGKQAYWHARLALILRGDDIHHLNIVNRSFDGAQRMIESLFRRDDGPVARHPIHQPKLAIITPHHPEYQRLLKQTLRQSAAIFCTVPSEEPLFPPAVLTSTEGRRRGRYISAVGSYKPHMVELHPDILRQAVAPDHGNHHHKHARQGGAVIVDSIEACMREAGEVIQAGLSGREVVELGELVMLKRDAEMRKRESEEQEGSGSGGKFLHHKRTKSQSYDDGLTDWLERGNVVYKSVGIGLMDIVVGAQLVDIADSRNIGVQIQDF
ncbi:hypothetical protein BDY21DRAFT_337743 [Lineolata rhizophorae]|uniref:NAD(P)-binding protein n=1 Tax=Lineolata rhizophorae TaxID=578093 RepID=A0A6A6P8F3_9PEZI|nr:hypothetical protein BDY21DRAFT_337743 [Lineolata rhizophorae]